MSITEASEPAWTSLRRTGSLVRSVQIGSNQDLAFESALALQVEGKVGSSVEIVAALSDQDLPIQPEGTTESIRELDKVFVTARSPNFEATVGDYELELPGQRFDRYARKLSGVRLGARTTGARVELSAAVSRGEFHSNNFAGLESVQGPYQLAGKNGETGIVVLAGTETVWVDGLEARRGANNDYTIDYAAGQIAFTPNKLITADSRIIVEFEYANEDYERQFLASRLSVADSSSDFGAFLTYLSERDDRTRPLGISLDKADVEQLREAGDSGTLGSAETADSLGVNGGDYTRRDTTTSGGIVSYFSFVPPSADGAPQGEWQVFFGDFGEGNGDYAARADSLGRTHFQWLGNGLGRYLPARRLPLPSSIDLVTARVERQPARGLRARIETALSNLDRNTYSARDDNDDDGAAGSAELGFSVPSVAFGAYHLRNLDVNATARLRGKTFADVSRSDELEFDREWAIAAVRQTDELIGESSIGLSPAKSLAVRGSGGVLSREDAMDSRRLSLNAAFTPSRNTALRVSRTDIASSDSTNATDVDWVRHAADAKTSLSRFAPRVRLNHERQLRNTRQTASGFRFLDWSAGTLVTFSNQLAIDGEAGQRHDDVRHADREFHDASAASTYSGELRWQPLDLGRGAFRWVHRDKEFASGDSVGISSDAGRLELLLTPRSRVVELNVLYDALKSRTEEQLQVFLPVASGTGSYSLVDGVYVPDDQGDFVLVSRNTGSFEASSAIHTNGTFWFRPDELRSERRDMWRRFAFETEASLDEETRLPLTLGLLLLNPSKLRTNSTIDGRFSLRQDVHFDRLSRRASFRLRMFNAATQIARYSNGGQESVSREANIRARVKLLPQLRGETEASYSLNQVTYQGVSLAPQDATIQSALQDLLWSLGERWEAGLSLTATEARDERSGTQTSVRELAPRIGYSRYNKGRVDAEFSWAHASSNRSVIPQTVGNGANRGENFRWSVRGTMAMSSNFSSSLSYTGRQDAGEEVVHVGRVEVRATF
ncbi:MAG: hypothetical protein IPG71_07360 [bacterium]|nr:hypothetical protein [bacterium]